MRATPTHAKHFDIVGGSKLTHWLVVGDVARLGEKRPPECTLVNARQSLHENINAQDYLINGSRDIGVRCHRERSR